MGCIYKITNILNGKKYIGQTSFSIQKRFLEHLKDAQRNKFQNRPLYSAINKYGKENFQIQVIQKCENSLLSQREQYWINFYNTYKDGYNATIGGQGSVKYNREFIIQVLKNNNYSLQQTAKIVGCCKDTVAQVAKIYQIDVYSHRNDKNKTKINQYLKDGTLIASFQSLQDAGKWCLNNNKTKQATSHGVAAVISRCINGKLKSAYGYIWKKI